MVPQALGVGLDHMANGSEGYFTRIFLIETVDQLLYRGPVHATH